VHGGCSDHGTSYRSDDHGRGHKDDDKGRGGSMPGGIGGGHGAGGGQTVQAGEPITLLVIGASLLGAAALRRRR